MVMDSDGVPLVSPHACSEASSTVLCPPSFSPSLPRPSLFPSPPPNPPVPLSNKGSRLECVLFFFFLHFFEWDEMAYHVLYFDGTTTSSFLATLCPAPRFPPHRPNTRIHPQDAVLSPFAHPVRSRSLATARAYTPTHPISQLFSDSNTYLLSQQAPRLLSSRPLPFSRFHTPPSDRTSL